MSFLTRLLRSNYNNSPATINPPIPPNAITNPQELQDYDGSYDAVIWNDIDMGNFGNFTPIPNLTSELNGLGYTISNLTINESTDNTGLFKNISDTGYTYNLYFDNIDITSTGDYTGVLAGYNNGTIENVGIILGTVEGEGNNVGGLVGINDGTITNSYATGEVTGSSNFIGGLIGYNWGAITNSYATGNVNGVSSVGGLVGDGFGAITNSYATGNVSGDIGVGGLVGYNDNTITNSYATGDVTGDIDVGGLIGYNWGGSINNSYRWDGQVVSSGANTEGTIVTTDNLYLVSWQETTLLFNINNWDLIDDQLPLIQGLKHQVPILKP